VSRSGKSTRLHCTDKSARPFVPTLFVALGFVLLGLFGLINHHFPQTGAAQIARPPATDPVAP